MARWLWIGLAAGCDDHLFGVAVDDCGAGSGFAGVLAVVDEHCIGCHGASPIGNGLDLATDPYGALIDGVGATNLRLVVPGDPERSYFYQKLVGTHTDGTSVMPVGGQLPDCLTDVVREWIADGASP